MHKSKIAWGMFLFGFGCPIKLVASLNATELFVFVMSPLWVANELPYMRRNGILPVFWLSICVVLGCVIACIANGTGFAYALRGMAVCCLQPCAIVVVHRLLRRNMSSFKWLILGIAISKFIIQLRFGGMGNAASTLYYVNAISQLLTAPAQGWYLSVPQIYCVVAPLISAFYLITRTESGRAASLVALLTASLVFLGGKKRAKMKKISRYFWMLMAAGLVGAFVLKGVYRIAATSGWMGEKARIKYEIQTKGKTGMMALLMGGRMESFCGLIACVDKPIVGFGPWAEDNGGYAAEFMARYGTDEDYRSRLKRELRRSESSKLNLIPCHSYITEFWLWYGIFGLLWWLFVIYVVLRFIRQDVWVVPQWYMWVVALMSKFLWDVMFSPYSDRVITVVMIVACLLARAVRKGRQQLPFEMQREIWENERK